MMGLRALSLEGQTPVVERKAASFNRPPNR